MMQTSIAEYLINALWQVPLLAAGAWCLVRAARPSPHVQHVFWVVVLGLAVLLPTHGTDTLPLHVALDSSHSGVVHELTLSGAGSRAAFLHQPLRPRHWIALPLARVAPSYTVRVNATWVHWLVRIYLGTVVLALLRMAHAWRSALLLTTDASDVTAHDALLERLSRRFGTSPPRVRESAQVASPMIVGAQSPILLVPEMFAQFTEEEVSAALCHELAHIRRHDFLINLGCQLAAAPLVWHPVLHVIQQRIRMSREMACDALAAGEMRSGLTYAKCLLSLASSLHVGPKWEPFTGSVGLFGGSFSKSGLEERIMQLTECTKANVKTRLSHAVAGAAVMSASLIVAATITAPAMAADHQKDPQVAQSQPVAAPEPAAAPEQEMPEVPPHITAKKSGLRPEQKAEIRRQVETARKQAAEAAATFNSEAFKWQMEQASRQAHDAARAMVANGAFQWNMEQSQRQMAEELSRVNTPEFRKQLEDAQKQAAEAIAMVNRPEFKLQMEEVQRQAAASAAHFDSPEFRKQMEGMQERVEEMMKDFHREAPSTSPRP